MHLLALSLGALASLGLTAPPAFLDFGVHPCIFAFEAGADSPFGTGPGLTRDGSLCPTFCLQYAANGNAFGNTADVPLYTRENSACVFMPQLGRFVNTSHAAATTCAPPANDLQACLDACAARDYPRHPAASLFGARRAALRAAQDLLPPDAATVIPADVVAYVCAPSSAKDVCRRRCDGHFASHQLRHACRRECTKPTCDGSTEWGAIACATPSYVSGLCDGTAAERAARPGSSCFINDGEAECVCPTNLDETCTQPRGCATNEACPMGDVCVNVLNTPLGKGCYPPGACTNRCDYYSGVSGCSVTPVGRVVCMCGSTECTEADRNECVPACTGLAEECIDSVCVVIGPGALDGVPVVDPSFSWEGLLIVAVVLALVLVGYGALVVQKVAGAQERHWFALCAGVIGIVADCVFVTWARVVGQPVAATIGTVAIVATVFIHLVASVVTNYLFVRGGKYPHTWAKTFPYAVVAMHFVSALAPGSARVWGSGIGNLYMLKRRLRSWMAWTLDIVAVTPFLTLDMPILLAQGYIIDRTAVVTSSLASFMACTLLVIIARLALLGAGYHERRTMRGIKKAATYTDVKLYSSDEEDDTRSDLSERIDSEEEEMPTKTGDVLFEVETQSTHSGASITPDEDTPVTEHTSSDQSEDAVSIASVDDPNFFADTGSAGYASHLTGTMRRLRLSGKDKSQTVPSRKPAAPDVQTRAASLMGSFSRGMAPRARINPLQFIQPDTEAEPLVPAKPISSITQSASGAARINPLQAAVAFNLDDDYDEDETTNESSSLIDDRGSLATRNSSIMSD